MTTQEMDAIFNGTAATINAAQNVCNALASGANDVKNIVENSRRNQTGYNNGGYVNDAYNQQPVTYSYGYADNGYNGYPGYGNYYNNSGMGYPNGDPDYYAGFSDPSYGNTGAPVPPAIGSNGNINPGPSGVNWF